MDTQPEGLPQCLLVHDGELGDVRSVLADLGTPFVERRGSLAAGDETAAWDLVLSTPGRVLDLRLVGKPDRIVVADTLSKTLGTSLNRAGITTLVRRPVHPAALRGLLLYALYRGPEKRRARRVAVGAPVRIRSGFSQFPAILADLSLGGCRLIASREVKPGKRFVLALPADVAPRAYRLSARALRSAPADDAGAAATSIHASFGPLSQRKLKLLKETILAYRRGPARLAEAHGGQDATTTQQSALAVERRDSPRQPTQQRVVALDEEADRVLMGRDISVGGMRVSASPHLTTGRDVKLALHLSGGAPLIVQARVHRDDGERGVVLRFHALSPDASAAILKLMATMPILEAGESEEDTGYVVSELLEVGTR